MAREHEEAIAEMRGASKMNADAIGEPLLRERASSS
jgi:hypothetical protein